MLVVQAVRIVDARAARTAPQEVHVLHVAMRTDPASAMLRESLAARRVGTKDVLPSAHGIGVRVQRPEPSQVEVGIAAALTPQSIVRVVHGGGVRHQIDHVPANQNQQANAAKNTDEDSSGTYSKTKDRQELEEGEQRCPDQGEQRGEHPQT